MNITLAAVVILLQLADAYLTIYGIKHGMREGWGPMQKLIDLLPETMKNVGPYTWLGVSKGALVALVIAMAFSPHDFITYILLGMAFVYAFVVAGNGMKVHEYVSGGG